LFPIRIPWWTPSVGQSVHRERKIPKWLEFRKNLPIKSENIFFLAAFCMGRFPDRESIDRQAGPAKKCVYGCLFPRAIFRVFPQDMPVKLSDSCMDE